MVKIMENPSITIYQSWDEMIPISNLDKVREAGVTDCIFAMDFDFILAEHAVFAKRFCGREKSPP